MLRDVSPSILDEHLAYILGKQVYQLKSKHLGMDIAGLTFELVLGYEFQIRRKAATLVNEDGKTLKEALADAAADSQLKERHFNTPLALQGAGGKARGKKRPFSPAAKVAAGPPASQRSGGRYTKFSGLLPGGKQICYAWSNRSEGCRGGCGREH
eukprot:2183721-Amphidinium_carterae.1